MSTNRTLAATTFLSDPSRLSVGTFDGETEEPILLHASGDGFVTILSVHMTYDCARKLIRELEDVTSPDYDICADCKTYKPLSR